MSEQRKETCRACLAWSPQFSVGSMFQPVKGFGECRRYAPRGPVRFTGSGKAGAKQAVISAFPLTAAEDWCLEHIPHPERVSR